MLKLRLENRRSTSQGFLALFVCLLMSACATQQTKDSSIDENIEIMKQLEEMEQSSAAVLVEQDLGLLSLHERNEKEALRNLQNEIVNETLRLPATQEEQQTETLPVNSSSATSNESLSKEELSQQLFDADTVVVQKGDSMSALAEKLYGNKKAWSSIWALNPNIQNPNVIEVGSKLYVPHTSHVDRSLASTPSPSNVSTANNSADNKEAQSSAASTSSAASAAPAKKIPDLKPKVQYKVDKVPPKVSLGPSLTKDIAPVISAEKAQKVEVAAPANPTHSPNLSSDAIESAFTVSGAASHTTDELLQEHLDFKRAKKYKGKDFPETLQRKISSVNDRGPDEVATSAAPKGLSKMVSLLGFLLLAGVIAGFIFSKPSKIQ